MIVSRGLKLLKKRQQNCRSTMEEKFSVYCSSLNPMARRIVEDIADIKKIKKQTVNGWDELNHEEQCRILGESFVAPKVKDKYSYYPYERPDVESFPKLALRSGEKYIMDDDVKGGTGYTWRDEHSGPFTWETQSQLDLSYDNGEKKPQQQQQQHIQQPSEAPPVHNKLKNLAITTTTTNNQQHQQTKINKKPSHKPPPPPPPISLSIQAQNNLNNINQNVAVKGNNEDAGGNGSFLHRQGKKATPEIIVNNQHPRAPPPPPPTTTTAPSQQSNNIISEKKMAKGDKNKLIISVAIDDGHNKKPEDISGIISPDSSIPKSGFDFLDNW